MMGEHYSKYLLPHIWREDEPDAHAPIKYDPQFGFDDKQRKPKVPRATQQEMDSAGLEPRARDSCANLRILYRGCLRHNVPMWHRCKGFYNELADCYYEEKLHDMKEFEREKRLNARERRLAQQTVA